LQDLKQHSIWKFNDVDDLTYPVISAEDFPENSFDLKIRSKFFTPTGIELLGYIVGVKNIYTITLYVRDMIINFNRNLPQYYQQDLDKLATVLGHKLTIFDFSPLKYITDIDLEGFRNIEGEFDLLKKRTDEERLKDL
jgi:hypothetical protein